ncbi:MAG: hypothetical protein ACYC2G_16710, partial [Gemmatimonadaceae bacterium]
MNSRQLRRRPAAFTPDSRRPICPCCWSRPDLDWGKGRGPGEREMRGWGVTTGEPVEMDGTRVPVAVAVHRCANRDCDTALVVTTLLGSGYVPELVEARRLVDADAAAYRAGRHDRAGV